MQDSDDEEEDEDKAAADAKETQGVGSGVMDSEVGMGRLLGERETDSGEDDEEDNTDLSEKSKKRPEKVATLKLNL